MRILCLIFVLVAGGPAVAETAYVTDMLQLDMYASMAMTDAPIKKLRSGDRLEVLERSGRYTRVRADGTDGWVKGLYLVTDEPARTRVNELESTNESLQQTAAELRVELEAEQVKVAELASAEAEARSLQDANASLQQKLAAYRGSVPLNWALAAVLAALLVGVCSSWYVFDRRSRARHGGYRVY